MVDQYWRKIEDVENNIENSMQISSILLKLKEYDEKLSDLSKIDTNTNNKYSIEKFFIYNIKIENNYKIDKDKPSFSIFKYTLEDDFKKDSILEINCRLLYQYHNYNHIGLLQHTFKLYDNTNTIFYDYESLKTNAGDNRRNDVKQNDIFYVKLDDDYDIIKIELILSLIDDVDNTVDCKIYNAYDSNSLCIKHHKKINLISMSNKSGVLENTILTNSSKIDANRNNISTNLINISGNEDNIAYDLSEITYIKNNISKSYLRHVYNILYYDAKEKIDFNNNFYDKTFELNAKKMILLR